MRLFSAQKALAAASAAMLLALPTAGLAHAGQRGFVMLLPTKLFIVGGGLAVALTFMLTAFLPVKLFRGQAVESESTALEPVSAWPSRLSLGILIALVACGHLGSRDPLSNPLPLLLWAVWWVGFTFLTALVGNAWATIHPWHAVQELLSAIPGRRHWTTKPLLAYPAWLSYWPATAGLFLFTWFELVYPAPQDPALLANAVLAYAIVTVLALMVFGKTVWLAHGDPFCLFFRMVGRLTPLRRVAATGPARHRWALGWPGRGLLGRRPLPASGIAFVLMALSAVSFDGLSRSFWWLGLIGENPLEYPGRTVLVLDNTLGLLAVFGTFLLVYSLTVELGRLLSGPGGESRQRRLVLSIIPIAFGYHFAHYLPEFLVDIQYALKAIADPMGTGLNLFGTANLHVYTSFLSHHESVEMIWYAQVTSIVLAHVLAVIVGHALAVREADEHKPAVLAQIPATLSMVAYTMFGLWLLSSPTAG